MYLTIENGFEDRKVQVDNMLVQRVIASYNKAKQAQRTQPEAYQVSYMWMPIYDKFMNEIITALTSGNVEEVSRIYGNFFRESCSVGLHGMPVDMESAYFSGDISEKNAKDYIDDVMHRLNVWLVSIGKTCPISALDTPMVGNPYGFFIDGRFFRAGVDYQHYYATMIGRLLRSRKHNFVLELGGGFGGLGYFLMRDNDNLTYVDVDLPENMALTAFYLLSAFPEKKIALFGELDLASDDLGQYDAIILPNFSIEEIKDGAMDLSFNSYSLAEMSVSTVANYISNFARITSKFICHINHTQKSAVKADDFGIEEKEFELIFRAPAMWNMARNKDFDEFEYVYKSKSFD